MPASARDATPSDVWPDGCPHPPAIAAEILRVAQVEIKAADIARDRSGLSPWFIPFHLAEQRVLARAQVAEQIQTKQIHALQAKIAQLEEFIFGTNDSSLESVLAQVVTALRQEIEARDRTRLRFCGIHEAGRVYGPGNLVVRGGGLWHCNEETRTVPGTTSDWQLCVKSGEVK
jgi:hypothetical protein